MRDASRGPTEHSRCATLGRRGDLCVQHRPLFSLSAIAVTDVTAPVKVLVDSSAGVSPDLAPVWGVDVVPLYLTWGGRTYRDGVDLPPADFYAELARSPTNPVTAAPNPADFVAACRRALEAGFRRVLVVTVSAAMSATHDHACLAAREIGTEKVAVVDSAQGAGAQALIAAHAARVAGTGAGLPDVVAAAHIARRSTELYMVVDTLKYLHRSGRISLPQAMMGELVRMKPILSFRDGRLQVVERPRTMNRAVERMIERLTVSDRRAVHALVMYAEAPGPADAFRERIRACWPDAEVDASPVSGVVGGHTGPGLLGVAVRWHDGFVSSVS